MRFQFRMWQLFLVILAIAVCFGFYWLKPIKLSFQVEEHLYTLRAGKIPEAYFGYTSGMFQRDHHPRYFLQLIEEHPILSTFTRISITHESVQKNVGTVEGFLVAINGMRYPFQYKLIYQGKEWKVLYFNIEKPIIATMAAAVMKSDEAVVIPIHQQIQAVRKKDYYHAYYGLISTDFSVDTSYEEFRGFLVDHTQLFQKKYKVTRKKNFADVRGHVTLTFETDEGIIPIEYQLVNEEGAWKIWSIKIITPVKEDAEVLPVNQFFTSLKEGNHETAYQQVSDRFRASTTSERFHYFLDVHTILSRYDYYQIVNATPNKVIVNVHQGSEFARYEFLLDQNGDQFKIQGIQEAKKS